MPGPTDDAQVAVSAAVLAAAGRADVTVDRSIASTSATALARDSARISGPTLPLLPAGTRLGRARHAPRRIDEMDPGLTRLEEELLPGGVPEGELVQHPVALPGAVHPQAVAEDRDRAAAGHPVVEAVRPERILDDARRPDVGGHDDDVLGEDRPAAVAVHRLRPVLGAAVALRRGVPGERRGPDPLERHGHR